MKPAAVNHVGTVSSKLIYINFIFTNILICNPHWITPVDFRIQRSLIIQVEES